MKTRKKIAGIAIILLAVAGLAGGYVLLRYLPAYFRPNTAFTKESVVICIPSGTSPGELVQQLTAERVLDDPDLLRALLASRTTPAAGFGGRYTVNRGMTTRQILNLIASRRQTPVNLVMLPARTLGEVAAHLAGQLEADSLAILEALTDQQMWSEYGFTRATFPSMLVPNTYQVYWDITPPKLVARLYREYKAFWNEGRVRQARDIGLTPLEVATLASIIQEEVLHPSELPTVAGVYMNRLRANMPLQACPTAKFAAGDLTLKRILKIHTQIDSPYNTYIHPGLPPGPIAIASTQAIEAVLHYDRHDYLYFCARADLSGYHHFSRTGEQHARYAAEYHRVLNRRGIR